MKNTTRQISTNIRSTKENKAGLSLLRPRLFEVIGDTYNYFNEIIQNTFKSMSPFLKRLTRKKFIEVPEYIHALSYEQPRLYAAMYFFITGDRWYYDYHGFNY